MRHATVRASWHSRRTSGPVIGEKFIMSLRIARNRRAQSALALTAGSALAFAALSGPSQSTAHADDYGIFHRHEPRHFSVALFGDMPYNALGKQQYPALL